MSRWFFHFFKILIIWVVRVVKRQKMVQNDKKLSVALHISGTIHHISFMVEICKMISPDVFFIVKILIFQVDKGLKGQIMDQHDENVCRTLYFRNHVSFDMILICGTHVVIKGQYLQALFSFLFLFFFFSKF